MTATGIPGTTPGQSRQWPMSVPAYHALGELGLIPEQTELLYGTVHLKMPKSPLHAALLRRLLRLLRDTVPPGCFLSQEQPITCLDSEPEPDLAFIRGREDDFWRAHPETAELIIEVCVTSHDHDRCKLNAYATAGIRECWLVLGPERQIEVYRQPEAGEYRERAVFHAEQTLNSAALPGVTVRLADLFAAVPEPAGAKSA